MDPGMIFAEAKQQLEQLPGPVGWAISLGPGGQLIVTIIAYGILMSGLILLGRLLGVSKGTLSQAIMLCTIGLLIVPSLIWPAGLMMIGWAFAIVIGEGM